MSTTYGALKTRVSLVLLDPDNKTFTAALVAELVKNALVELGRIAPVQFTEDLTPVADQLTYAVQSAEFSAVAVPEIELVRVEVWDPTQAPAQLIAEVQPAGNVGWSWADSGWSMWGGALTLPTRVVRGLQGYEDAYVIRLWGYRPYVMPVADDDVIETSWEIEQACLSFIYLEGLRILLANRNLFTQWQTRSGNVDMSPAALMNEKNMAASEWRQLSRNLMRLRARA